MLRDCIAWGKFCHSKYSLIQRYQYIVCTKDILTYLKIYQEIQCAIIGFSPKNIIHSIYVQFKIYVELFIQVNKQVVRLATTGFQSSWWEIETRLTIWLFLGPGCSQYQSISQMWLFCVITLVPELSYYKNCYHKLLPL